MTKVATVDAKGNVKAKGVGTVKITATNNKVSKTVTIKVVKAANPMKVTAKKTVTANSKKNTTIKSVVTVKSAQGKVTYKRPTTRRLQLSPVSSLLRRA